MNGNDLNPEEFTLAAAQRLAAEPDVEIVNVGELSIDLRVAGREVKGDLGNFYTLYQQAPDQIEAIWSALAEALTTLPPDRTEDNPAVLLSRIFPMVKPLALLSEVREQNLPLLAYRPFVGELMIAYVIDEGASVAFVSEDHLQRWGVREPIVYAQALDNLRAKEWTPHPGILGTGRSGLLIFNGRDGFDATRVLLPELFAEFAAKVPGNVVIGIPNRDFLIAFSDADPGIFNQISTQIETDARTQAYALTGQLLTLRQGQIALYDPIMRRSG